MNSKPLEELVKGLPPQIQDEVRDFVEFLLAKRQRPPGRRLRQDWAGALRDYRDQYSSLELQKKALEWRGEFRRRLRPNRTRQEDAGGDSCGAEPAAVAAAQRRAEQPEGTSLVVPSDTFHAAKSGLNAVQEAECDGAAIAHPVDQQCVGFENHGIRRQEVPRSILSRNRLAAR